MEKKPRKKPAEVPAAGESPMPVTGHDSPYFGILPGGKKKKFRIEFCDDSIAWLEDRIWAADQKITKTGKTTIIKFTSSELVKVLDWVLSHGAAALPHSPPELVKLWKKTITAMSIVAKLGKLY